MPTADEPKTGRKYASYQDYRAAYMQWLEEQRGLNGTEWYDKKLADFQSKERKRLEAFDEARKLARLAWTRNIDAWSAAGGFQQTLERLEKLAMGAPENNHRTRLRYHVGSVPFEVNLAEQACTRWDQNKFSNGKTGSRGALGLAACYFELLGEAKPYRTACALVTELSGIKLEDTEITAETKHNLQEMQKRQLALAAEREAAALREDPLSAEDKEEAPVPITDPAQVEKLTALMAEERAFELDYARRLVSEGSIWFGEWQFRAKDGADSGKVVNSHRPIVVSDVYGIATGVHVGYAGREFNRFIAGTNIQKGKNLGQITKGIHAIGKWNEQTKKVWLFEGAYNAHALRLMRERRQQPLAPDEAFLVFAGSRVPDRLLQICHERGIEVHLCFDADAQGHNNAAKAQAWAQEHQLPPYATHFPPRAETTWRLPDSQVSRFTYEKIVQRLQTDGIRFQFLPQEKGELSLVVETTAASCQIFEEYQKITRLTNQLATAEDGEPKGILKASWHRKDWNDLLQNRAYRTRANNRSGIPEVIPEAEEQLQRYLSNRHVSPTLAQDLRQHGIVYPGLIDGQPQAVWIAMDLATRVPRGFRVEPFEGTTRAQGYGRSDQVAIWLGNPQRAEALALAFSVDEATAAFEGTQREIAVALPLDANTVMPEQLIAVAKERSLPIAPLLPSGDAALGLEADITHIARTQDLKITPLTPPTVPARAVGVPSI